MELTTKQKLFVEAYLGEASGNASEAARIAGYTNPATIGYRLLKKSMVRAAINRRLRTKAMGTDEILSRLSEFASGSLEHFIDLTPDGGWTLNLARAKKASKLGLLKKLKMGRYGPEIEIHSPLDALEKLARYHGMYAPERIEHSAGGDLKSIRDYLEGLDDGPDPGESNVAGHRN